MGRLVDGQWQDVWYDTKSSKGKYVRKESQFRDWISADGSTGFQAEADRYHLYISYACPWACRVLIFRQLKKLDKVIGLSIVDPFMAEHGWTFTNNENCIADSVNHADYLHQLYTLADPHYSGRVTVPVLWDKQRKTIVSNESADLIRMLNAEFNALTDVDTNYYPTQLAAEIDKMNTFVYSNVNNGVYKCGFATSQEAYDVAFDNLFSALDELEKRLSKQRYLVGQQITEADWRLFTTLVRFDAVYVGHFKCNRQRIADYDHLQNYLRELYQHSGIANTVNMDHIKRHYYQSHDTINPTQIVPKGPQLSLLDKHDRDQLN